VLVVHDWGSALGFDWPAIHRSDLRGIAYMEAIVATVAFAGMERVGDADLPGLSFPTKGENHDSRAHMFIEAGAAGVDLAETDQRPR